MAAGPLILCGLAVYSVALSVSVLWAAWSIVRHGWRKRSTRRYTYYFYIALHAVRLWWLAALARSGVDGTLDESELLSPTVAVLNRLALCLGYNAISMVVFGWANVTSATAGPCGRALTARWVFAGVNLANWMLQAGLCAALCALAARGPSTRLTWLVQIDVALLVAFAAQLAVFATAFGLLLSSRFIELAAAAADPTLGAYVAVKFNKMNVAWHTFCACFALRAVFLAASLPGIGPVVGRAHYFWFGYYIPDVLPTLVALIVLRKRTLPFSCCGLCSPAHPADSSASELHQQLIFSPSAHGRVSAGAGGGSTGGSYFGASDGSESGRGGGRKSSSGGEM